MPTMKGKIKWKAKNRVKVTLFTANSLQIHCTRLVPRNGWKKFG